MEEDKQQVRIIELEAIKLAPNAKYLLVVNKINVTPAAVEATLQNMSTELREKISVLPVIGPPEDAVKLYEVPEDGKTDKN